MKRSEKLHGLHESTGTKEETDPDVDTGSVGGGEVGGDESSGSRGGQSVGVGTKRACNDFTTRLSVP